ncbi:LysR family transcriptional regulator [Adlercreutzia sp. ZJ242]|uniref:LysR family transcriptional regulator n=1 Tax=Adlercreutzia sp. ZJ242 TaxID=2709409 RepID=UPI00197F58BE|nr:LysR family transcriptional regulator [Adlercreutzia sp. ZJ242]
MLNRRIGTFIVVAESGSFSLAAKQLFVSAVSVKKQMDSLEAEVGVKLFHRTNRGVGLTDAGRILLDAAKRMRQMSDSTLREMRRASEAEKPMVKVGTSLLRPCSRLLDIWSRNDMDADYGIEIVSFDDGTELDSVIGELGSRIDCFLGPCDAPAWHEMCNVLKLGFYECKIAVPRSHSLACESALTWDDLSGQSLMLVKPGSSPVLDSIRSEIESHHPGIEIVDTPSFYSIDTFNECERRSILLETLDAWDNVHPGFVSIPMDWSYRVPFGLLYSKNPSPEMERFASGLSDARRTSS